VAYAFRARPVCGREDGPGGLGFVAAVCTRVSRPGWFLTGKTGRVRFGAFAGAHKGSRQKPNAPVPRDGRYINFSEANAEAFVVGVACWPNRVGLNQKPCG